MARHSDYGTAHVGVRRWGETVWAEPGRGWETFDRATLATIGPAPHQTLGDAIAYAQYREGSTYGYSPACDLHGASCPSPRPCAYADAAECAAAREGTAAECPQHGPRATIVAAYTAADAAGWPEGSDPAGQSASAIRRPSPIDGFASLAQHGSRPNGAADRKGIGDMARSWDELRGDIFDSRDIIDRIAELEASEDQDLIAAADPQALDDRDELALLRTIAAEGETVPDWRYGETFIPEDRFEDYARDLAEDIGAIDREASWPNTYIDWAAAADALKMDYSAFTFDGIDYWARSRRATGCGGSTRHSRPCRSTLRPMPAGNRPRRG